MARVNAGKSVSRGVRTSSAGGAKPAGKGSSAARPARTVEAKPIKTKAPDMSSYANALKWLYERTDIERQRNARYSDDAFKLDRMRELLKRRPLPPPRIIHVYTKVSEARP